MSQLTQSVMSGLALALRRSWTHSLLPFSDAMYKAVWPFYVYVKNKQQMNVSINEVKVIE